MYLKNIISVKSVLFPVNSFISTHLMCVLYKYFLQFHSPYFRLKDHKLFAKLTKIFYDFFVLCIHIIFFTLVSFILFISFSFFFSWLLLLLLFYFGLFAFFFNFYLILFLIFYFHFVLFRHILSCSSYVPLHGLKTSYPQSTKFLVKKSGMCYYFIMEIRYVDEHEEIF